MQSLGIGASVYKWFAAAITWIAAHFAFTERVLSLFFVASVLIAFDTATGVAAATKRGEPIRSRALAKTLWKLTGYAIAVTTVWLMLGTVDALSTIQEEVAVAILSFVVVIEGWSIIENLDFLGIKIPPAIRNLLREKLGGDKLNSEKPKE